VRFPRHVCDSQKPIRTLHRGFPRSAPREKGTRVEAEKSPAPIWVLVVSPLPELAAPIAAVLKSLGGSPVCVSSAEDAVRVLRGHRVDLMVVDHMLPGVNGAEFIARLRASRRSDLRSVPIIGFAGKLGTERDMMAAGATCFVEKGARSSGLAKAFQWIVEVYGCVPAERDRKPRQDVTPLP
jgi:CheY-like chemotaxis protein